MYKNRYRKAKKFRLGVRHEQYDGLDPYGDLMVDDQFVNKSKNIIKMDWDWCDYHHLNNFYRLHSNPYRRLIENSVGKEWDNVLNYIKRKIGRKGERFYRMYKMMEGNFPQKTFVDDGKIYFVETKYRSGGFIEPYAGEIYIDQFGIVRKTPNGERRVRYRWRPSSEDKFSIYDVKRRRQFKVDDDLMYRELNNSYNQRLGSGRFNVVDEYNWFKLQYTEYTYMDKQWVKNKSTGEYEMQQYERKNSRLTRASANKKDIKRLKLNEVK